LSLEEAQFYIKLDFQLSKKFNNGIKQVFKVRDEITHDEVTPRRNDLRRNDLRRNDPRRNNPRRNGRDEMTIFQTIFHEK
jgi:hypothetical protein